MKTLTIRNVPEDLHEALQRERSRRGSSLNQTVVDLLRQRLGVGMTRSNGLGKLAGGWTDEEFARFGEAVEPFERIDEDLWSESLLPGGLMTRTGRCVRARMPRKLKRATHDSTYGNLYGMDKTTVYLTPALRRALRETARQRQTSEAALIREGIAVVTARRTDPRPRLPLFESGDPTLADRVDELLAGFGQG
jgi:hypothetical protein